MSRSLKKGIYVDERLMEKIRKAKSSGNPNLMIKTWSRRSLVTPEMVGLALGVHNGRTHVSVSLLESMVGHRLGEFAPSRTFRKHSKKGAKSSVSEGRV